jgi:hypothetical protein
LRQLSSTSRDVHVAIVDTPPILVNDARIARAVDGLG